MSVGISVIRALIEPKALTTEEDTMKDTWERRLRDARQLIVTALDRLSDMPGSMPSNDTGRAKGKAEEFLVQAKHAIETLLGE